MAICLSVCYRGYTNTTGWIFLQELDFGPTLITLHFERDLDQLPDTKEKNLDFLTYSLLQALAEACTPLLLLFCVNSCEVFVVADACAFPETDNSSLVVDLVTPDHVEATYTCLRNTWFPDKSRVKYLTCNCSYNDLDYHSMEDLTCQNRK